MRVVGIVGYVEFPRSLTLLTSVWADRLSDECKRSFYKNWYMCEKKAYTKYQKRWAEASLGPSTIVLCGQF